MTKPHDIGPGATPLPDPGRGLVALVCVVAFLTPPLLAGAREQIRPREDTGSGDAGVRDRARRAARALRAADAAPARSAVKPRSRRPAAFLITTVIATATDPEPTELLAPGPQSARPGSPADRTRPARFLTLARRGDDLQVPAPRRYRLAPKGSPPV